MPNRSYTVDYNINASTQNAINAFNAMIAPMQNLANQLQVVENRLNTFKELQSSIQQMKNIQFTPTVNLSQFKDALASMEVNAKETATRIRAVMETALIGTQKDFKKVSSALGTNNFKEIKAGHLSAINEAKELQGLVKTIYDSGRQINKGTTQQRKAEIEQARLKIGSLKDQWENNTRVNEFAQNKLGMDRFIGFDYGKNAFNSINVDQYREFQKRLEEYRQRLIAQNKGQSDEFHERRKNLQKEIGTTRKASTGNPFGIVGINPAEIGAIATSIKTLTESLSTLPKTGYEIPINLKIGNISSIQTELESQLAKLQAVANERRIILNSILGNGAQKAVQQQEKAVNKTPNLKYLGPSGKLNFAGGFSKPIKPFADSEWRGIKSAINNPNLWTGTSDDDVAMQDRLENRYNQMLQQRATYLEQLRQWRSRGSWVRPQQPLKAEIQKVDSVKAIQGAPTATSETLVSLNIVGNFEQKLPNLQIAREILSTLPKNVSAAVNITTPPQAKMAQIETLKSLKNKEVSIGVKASVSGLKNIENVKEKTNIQGGLKEIAVKAIIDMSSLNASLSQAIANLQNLANEKYVKIKAVLDRTTLGQSLQSAITNLQQLANERFIKLKAVLDRTTLGQSLHSAITNLQQLANERFVRLKTLLDQSSSLSEVQGIVSSIQQLANERFIKLKAVLDRTTLGQSLQASISNLQQLANSRAINIKVAISSSGLSAKLRQMITDLKSVINSTALHIKATVDKITMPKTKPVVKVSAIIDKSPRFANGVTSGLTANIRGIIRIMKSQVNAAIQSIGDVFIKAKVQLGWATGAGSKQTQLKNLQSKLPSLKIKLDITEAETVLNRLIAKIKALSPQTIRLNTNQRGTGGTGVTNRIYTGSISGMNRTGYSGVNGTNRGNLYDRTRNAMYPFTGNTSFGARTPAAFGMMKGMGMMYGVGGVMSILTDSFNQAANYQNTMETARAILKANYVGNNFDNDFNEAAKIARDIAVKTKFTAEQTGEAFRFMAMAGLDIPMIKHSIAPIADLAVIGDNDLGEVADKMTNIQTAFKIQPDKMRHLADAMAKTVTSSNTDIMMLAESMQYAGPMAHLAGASVEDTLAMLGVMANSGIQGSMGGTTLRMMYQNVINPTKKQQAVWDNLGIKLRDKNGGIRNLIDIMDELAKKTKSEKQFVELLGGEDKATGNKKIDQAAGERTGVNVADSLSKIFRVTATAGAGSILESIRQVKELRDSLVNSNGISQSISEAKQNTVSGLRYQVTSAFTEAVVKVFEMPETQNTVFNILNKLKNTFSDPEFPKTLNSVFNIVVDVTKTMGWFAEKWLWLYQTFRPIVKWVVIGQALFTQIGYLATPFVQLIGLFSKLGGAMGVLTAHTTALTTSMIRTGAATGIGTGASAMSIMASRNAMMFGEAGIAGMTTGELRRQTANKLATANNKSKRYTSEYIDYLILSQALYSRNSIGRRIGQARANRNNAVTNVLSGGTPQQRFRGEYVANKEAINNRRKGLQKLVKERFSSAMLTPAQEAQRANIIREIQQLNSQSAGYTRALRQLNEERIRNRVVTNEMLVAMNQSGHLKMGKAAKIAFSTGMNGLAFAGILGSLKTTFTNLCLGLSKAIGMLVSPAGLAITAISAVGYALYSLYEKRKEANDKFLNVANKSKEALKETTDRQNKLGDNPILDTVNEKPINEDWDKGKKFIQKTKFSVDPQINHNTAFKDIFSWNKDVNIDRYLKSIYENHISQTNQDLTYEEFKNGLEQRSKDWLRNAGVTNKTKNDLMAEYAKQMAQESAVQQLALRNPEFIKKQNEYLNKINAFSKLPFEEQEKKRGELLDWINKTQQSFNPDKITNLNSVSDFKNFGTARTSDLMYTREAFKFMFDYFNRVKEDDDAPLNIIESRNNIIDYLSGNANKLSDSDIGNILSNVQIPFKDQNGDVKRVALAFDGMKPVWGKFFEQLKQNGINVENNEKTRQLILERVLGKFDNIPGLTGIVNKLGGISLLISKILGKIDPFYHEAAAEWAENALSNIQKLSPWSPNYENEQDNSPANNFGATWITEFGKQTKKQNESLFGNAQKRQSSDKNENNLIIPFWQQNEKSKSENGNSMSSMQAAYIPNQDEYAYKQPASNQQNGNAKTPLQINLGGIHLENMQIHNADMAANADQLQEIITDKVVKGVVTAFDMLNSYG